MRTELQYNLQRARALATELRCTIEAINEGADHPFSSNQIGEIEGMEAMAGEIEGWLDDMSDSIIGQGSVKLTIEEYLPLDPLCQHSLPEVAHGKAFCSKCGGEF